MEDQQSPNFTSIEDKIFTEYKGDIYIGKEKIKPDFKGVLKDQARSLVTSDLYEVFHATLLNEAYSIALDQSTNFEQVQFAKALKHVVFMVDNILIKVQK